MSLGERLRDVRVRHAVSEEVLALRVGLSPSDAADVEAGLAVPPHEALEKWARALEVPFYRLFFGTAEAVLTPRLTPLVTLENPARPWPRGVLAILFDWLQHAASALLGRDKAPQARSGS